MDETHLFRKIVGNAGDAMIFADTDGRIELWNQGAEDIFGHTEEEALGESLDIIIPKQLRDRHWDGYYTAMEQGSTTYERGDRLSVPAVRKDGERLSVAFTVTLIDDSDGKLAGIAAILRDVTDQWDAQQERTERIQELEGRIDENR